MEASKLVSGTFAERMQQINANLAEKQYQYKMTYEAPVALQQKAMNDFVLDNAEAKQALVDTLNSKTGSKYTVSSFDNLPQQLKESLNIIGMSGLGFQRSKIWDDKAGKFVEPEGAEGAEKNPGLFMPSQVLAAYTNSQVPLTNDKARQLLGTMRASWDQTTQDLTRESKTNMALQNPEALKAAIESRFNNYWNHINDNIVSESAPGIGMPTFGEVKAFADPKTGESIANVPLWGQVLSKFADNPASMNTRPSSTQMLSYANQLVADGKLTSKEAASQLAQIGDIFIAYNNLSSDRTALGLPTQSNMKVQAPEFVGKTLSGGTKVLDLSTSGRAEIQNYLERQQAAGIIQRMGATANRIATDIDQAPQQAVNWTGRNILGVEPTSQARTNAGER